MTKSRRNKPARGKREQPSEQLTGRVAEQLVRPGTASEHVAMVLETETGERIILQRIGGNPFADPDTRRLAGHEIRVVGYRLGDIFRFVKAEDK